jgi:acyl dehydratase
MSDEDHELTTDQSDREASGARGYGRYLEEFEVGAVYKHWPAKTITESEDHLFCLLTMNHHPLHINDVYASNSQQGRNVSARTSTTDVRYDGQRSRAATPTWPPTTSANQTGSPRRHALRRVGARGATSRRRTALPRVHTAANQDGTLVAEFKRAVLVPRKTEA